MLVSAGPWLKTLPVADLFPILHEDADLLAINKPAGLVCHPTKGDVYSSLISRVRQLTSKGFSTALETFRLCPPRRERVAMLYEM